MDNKFSRKKFITTALTVGGGVALGLNIAGCKNTKKIIPGSLLGANAKTGHKLRDGKFKEPTEFDTKDYVIVGGGIAGLSAARYLHSKGITNFVLLDLEEQAGGNSRSGNNAVSAYPWGAHYLPIPGTEHKEILDFLNEAGCINNFTPQGLPVYNELYLCHAPEERLFINGIWQNGIIPQLGNTKNDNDEIERFHKLMEGYKNAIDSNGKPLFALPVDDSAFTPETIALDKISFVDFLKQKGFTSEKLFWYVNYCCRDDYGTDSAKTSAFAGIHYFAGRRGVAANAENGDVLTWPEGNGFLANKLQQYTKGYIKTNALVYKVEQGPDNLCYVYYNKAGTDTTVKITARKVLMATPQFINKRLVSNARQLNYDAFTYAPWMVANLTLKSTPFDRSDNRPLSWDNVLYKSTSLGYINSCHQSTKLHQKKVVLTYYKPLSDGEPVQMRQQAHAKNIDTFQHEIIADLKRAHPNIEDEIESIDVWLWGHAMARPTLGFLTGSERKQAQQTINNAIYFAHSDLGLPVFEEAFYQGYRAAEKMVNSNPV